MNLPKIVKDKLISLGAGLRDSFLVAVSGGADSTALLLAMRESVCDTKKLTAAHLDHGMRAGSKQDLDRIVELCGKLGIRLVTHRLQREDLEEKRRVHGSLEAGMRDLRYDFLSRSAQRTASRWIATGHTADDQAETILFRLSRGMDWRSLGGIPERRGNIIRPLIDVSRSETLRYCFSLGITPVIDPTNYDETFARGRIRNRVLPGLRDHYHPEIVSHLMRTGRAARHLTALEDKILREMAPVPGWEGRKAIDRESLAAIPRTLAEGAVVQYLAGCLQEYPSRTLVGDVLDFVLSGANGQISLRGNMVLHCTYGHVHLTEGPGLGKGGLPSGVRELKIPGRTVLTAAGMAITVKETTLRSPGEYPRGRTALLAGTAVREGLWVRKRLPGDRFMPLGMKNHRKLKDFLVDRKIPRVERDFIPLLVNSRGEILWVGGVEISQLAALEGAAGEKAILVSIEDLSRGDENGRRQDG